MKTIEEEYTYLKSKFRSNPKDPIHTEITESISLINLLENHINNNLYLGNVKIRRELYNLKRKTLTPFDEECLLERNGR